MATYEWVHFGPHSPARAVFVTGAAEPAMPATVGDYTVTVEVAGECLTKPVRVRVRDRDRIGA